MPTRFQMLSNQPSSNKKLFTKVNEEIILIHQDSMATMNFNSCNCYLINISKKEYAIIDPGCSKRKLNTTLKQNEIRFSEIKYFYITHGHSDHIGLIDYLQKKNEAIQGYIHELDKRFIESSKEYYNMLFDISLIKNNKKYKDFIDALNYYTTSNSNIPIKQSFKMIFNIWNVKNRKISNTFKDGEILPGNLKVIHAPGHTPGMCMLYKEKDYLLFSSDIHLSSIGPNFSGNYINISDFKTSINKIIRLVESGLVKVILSGHGKNPITENLKTRLLDFYEDITAKENQLLRLLQEKGKLTLEQITNETFKEYIKRFEKFLHKIELRDTIVIAEASEMMSNLNILNELEKLGKVSKQRRENEIYWT
ncbi:MAG: MBL fold metallo-hydrolase [Candidatus Hermodarchaeota archaeon]